MGEVMTSKERVLKAIRHVEPDRVPLNIWLYRDDYNELITSKYGSVDNFYDEYGIDIYTVFAPGPRFSMGTATSAREALELPLNDPSDDSLYDGVREAVAKYGNIKNRAVFCQTGAVFEWSAGMLGIANNLMELAADREGMKQWYMRLAEWFTDQAEKVAGCGVDVIHLSDDWGENNRLMFSPKDWWELIFPADKMIVDRIKSLGLPVSLHSDGCIEDVLDGCVEMGIDVLNPIQTSAGMDPFRIKRKYGDKLALYGTLDIRDLPVIPVEGLHDRVKSYMDNLKTGGGYIFCTAHTVQPDTDLCRVEMAYKWALEYGCY